MFSEADEKKTVKRQNNEFDFMQLQKVEELTRHRDQLEESSQNLVAVNCTLVFIDDHFVNCTFPVDFCLCSL